MRWFPALFAPPPTMLPPLLPNAMLLGVAVGLTWPACGIFWLICGGGGPVGGPVFLELGRTWMRVAFHLNGMAGLYAASTKTRSYMNRNHLC